MRSLAKFILLTTVILLSSIFSTAQNQDSGYREVPWPVFKNGEAQVVPEFNKPSEWIKEELWVETVFDSDNDSKPDRMHVFVTRPLQTETGQLQLPVIYMSSPYYGLRMWALLTMSSEKFFWSVKHEIGETSKSHKHKNPGTRRKRPFESLYMDRMWVPRGYILVYSSSPGTGLSDGAPTIGGDNESLAPKAVIDWLCGRARGYSSRNGNEEVFAFWCNGKVGMTGTSYDGTLCLAAATTGVEGLDAIIPVAPVSSFYHYYRSNGMVRAPGGYQGEDVDVLYDMINTGDKSKRKHNNRFVRDSILVKNHDRITGDYNDFWSSRDYLNRIDSMKAAMIMSHAFNDWNVMPEQSYRFYHAAKERGIPVQLYYHQDGHGGNPPFRMMNRWFTRYLHDIENDVEDDPVVWIVREHQYAPTPYADFPDPGASDVKLHLSSGEGVTGQLSPQETEIVGTMTFTDDYTISGGNLTDSRNADHRLLFLTPMLEEELRISGVVKVTIRLASSKPAANLSVWLVSLPWEEEKTTMIYDNIITRGWADPQNHSSVTQGEPLKPGEFYNVTFDLMPDDQVIRKGQQIGLMIFASDKEFTICPKPGTELTVDLKATSITLPVVGGIVKYKQAVNSY